MDKHEVDELLRRFLDQLKQQRFPESTIQEELRDFVAGGLDRYLAGGNTLDAAFGLKPKRGASGNPDRRRLIAHAVLPLKLKGWSWKRITDQLACGMDERDIRRAWQEFKVEVMATAVSDKLDRGPPGEK